MNDASTVEDGEIILRCLVCGGVSQQLHAADRRVHSLSLGVDVDVGDLLCQLCLLQLQGEFSQEGLLRGPA
jgi:hypothetical protein